MKTTIKKVKDTAKYITWVLLGVMYFPIYFVFWVLRFVSRLVLAISYYGTLNSMMGYRVMRTLFSKDYERNF